MSKLSALRPPETDYTKVVETFVRTGAALIKQSIPGRYEGLVRENPDRPLEPGFIPPERRARVTIVSYYPNDGDLRGDVDYAALRRNYANWGDSGSVEDYRMAYADWLASLPRIPFYRDHTLPVLTSADLSPDEIAWLPLIKVPMRPKSKVPEKVVKIDREDLWEQILLLRPEIVWVQGIGTNEWIAPLLRERITDKIVPQSLEPYLTGEEYDEIVTKVAEKLKTWLTA